MVDHGANHFNYILREADSADDWGYNTFVTDTLAHCAARSGNLEIVQYLASKGTEFKNVTIEDGRKPLDVAVGDDVKAYISGL